MKHIGAILCWIVLCALPTRADEPYPPPGFDRVESKKCKGYTLILFTKPPGDFSCDSQIWLDPSKPKFKRQLLFSYQNRTAPYVDDSERHIAIQHHMYSTDNLMWLFVYKPDGLFHRVPQEMRAAGLEEFCRQTHMSMTRESFDHFDCYADAWLKDGLIRCYIRGDSPDKSFYLDPWYFIYDSEHERIVPHDFPGNAKAFVRDAR